MKYLGPTRHPRLNEAVAVVYLLAGLFVFFSLVSYQPFDPSWNSATGVAKPVNLTGQIGSYLSDFFLQGLGIGAYSIPILIILLGWRWIRSSPIEGAWAKLFGAGMFVAATCTGFGFFSGWTPIASAIPAGGLIGSLLADTLISYMNLTGAALFTAAC